MVYELSPKDKIGDNSIYVETEDSDVVKHILSLIYVKKMIPVKDGIYSIIDLNRNDADQPSDAKYKDLLNKEYLFCLKNINVIISSASTLFQQQMSTGQAIKFCCDFKSLETICDNYETHID